MMLEIIDAEYMGDYNLRCTFNDGAVKVVDMSPLLGFPAFESLKDRDEFCRFGLDHTIFWGNGADIAPEWLYEHGQDCPAQTV